MSHPLQKADDFAPIKPQAAGALVSDARAGEIRGELTAKHGATWLHYYAREIEAEVLRVLASSQNTNAFAFTPVHIPEATPHPKREEILEKAEALYGSDDIEIADAPKLSEAIDGCWVQAWVWVAGEEYGNTTPEEREQLNANAELSRDEVKCPHCDYIANVGSLIGPTTDDCPACGKPVLAERTYYSVIVTNDEGISVHGFDTDEARTVWLESQDDTFDSFISVDSQAPLTQVYGSIVGS